MDPQARSLVIRQQAKEDGCEVISCRICGCCVCTTNELVNHTKGGNHSAQNANFVASDKCMSWFVENQEWMGDCSENSGKLLCPKCSGRLGLFSWSGSQCACGAWVAPAFQLTKSKVDRKIA